MKKLYTSIATVLSVGCVAAGTDNPSILNTALLEAYRNLPESLEQGREPITFANGEMARNCHQYKRLRAKSSLVETVNNQLVKSEYLVCEALGVILTSRLGEASGQSESAGEGLYQNLDLSEVPLSIKQALPEGKSTLADLPEHTREFSAHSVQVNYAGVRIGVELVAIADVNQDGNEDWIVWLADEVEDGSYRSYQTLIVSDVNDGDSLWTTEVVNGLR